MLARTIVLGESLHTVPSLPSGNLASSRSERLTARLEAFTLNPFQDFLDPVLVMRYGVLGRFVRCAVDVQQELSQLNFTILSWPKVSIKSVILSRSDDV